MLKEPRVRVKGGKTGEEGNKESKYEAGKRMMKEARGRQKGGK
jgi:hypothetical protein